MLNEEEVFALLEPLGFEAITMDGRSIGEQAALFASAAVIVATHGAALANLVFSRPGTTVIELMGTNTASPVFAIPRVASWPRLPDDHGDRSSAPRRWWTWQIDADTVVDVRGLKLVPRTARTRLAPRTWPWRANFWTVCNSVRTRAMRFRNLTGVVSDRANVPCRRQR